MPRANSKFEKIYNDLLEKIRTGVLEVGQTLPPEVVLAKEYGVAVLTLRRALARLREEGLIVSRPRHGSQVVSNTHQVRSVAKTKTIALFAAGHANALAHPPNSRLFAGVEGVATAAGYTLEIFFNDLSNPAVTEGLLQRLEQSQVQGWLIPSFPSESVRRFFRKSRLPVVMINYTDPEISEHVFQTDFSGVSRAILQHLLEQGRSRIWLFTLPRTSGWDKGILEAAKALGVADRVQSRLIANYSVQAGRAAAEELLEAGEAVDAIVCPDDEIAAGAIQALQAAGLSVPESVSVIGGGDFPIGSLMNPPLSTVSYPTYNIGREAGRLLIDLIEGHDVPPAHRLYLPKFIVRQSSQPSWAQKT